MGNLEITSMPPSGDSQSTPPHRDIPPELRTAYSQIGRVLLIAEAASPSIGIPWVPPTRRTRALQAEYFEPFKDFIRSSLSTVSTNALESYSDDIEELPPTDLSAEQLCIAGLSLIERLALPIAVLVTCFGGLLLSAVWAKASPSMSVGIALGVSVLVAAVCAYVCSESSRRSTFHWLVVEELMRRKGLDEQDGTPIPVYGLPTSPATKG